MVIGTVNRYTVLPSHWRVPHFLPLLPVWKHSGRCLCCLIETPVQSGGHWSSNWIHSCANESQYVPTAQHTPTALVTWPWGVSVLHLYPDGQYPCSHGSPAAPTYGGPLRTVRHWPPQAQSLPWTMVPGAAGAGHAPLWPPRTSLFALQNFHWPASQIVSQVAHSLGLLVPETNLAGRAAPSL